MTPDQHRTAKAVLALLVANEPRPANHGPGWIVTVERRIRAERWPDVCALVAEHPDADPHELADMASPAVASAPAGGNFQTAEPVTLTEWDGPEHDPDAGPVIDDPRPKLAAARRALAAVRKPEMGPPPVATRGAVH